MLASKRSLDELGLAELATRLPPGHVRAVDAGTFSQASLGRSFSNVALLGSFAAVTGTVGLAAVLEAIRARFKGTAREGNLVAARAAYELVTGAA